MKHLRFTIPLLILCGLFMASCGGGKKGASSSTGWNYNDSKWGGFEKTDYDGQVTGPNLVLVQGGTFPMGLTEQDVTFEWNNVPRRVTVSSFYMDETEVTNIDYREYLFWLKRVFGETYPEHVRKALPDTLVWREELSYNEPLVENYFRYPSYDLYPVVGVSWNQANEYSKWRTDRVNEMILIEKGILNFTQDQKDEDNFDSEAYLASQYTGDVRKNKKDVSTGGERQVKMEDGILLPPYRLPTEAEWEYAALSLIGNQASEKDELYSDRKIYPWNGATLREQKRNKDQGKILANFKRGAGDYAGMAGKLNDAGMISTRVRTFLPNDFGLYGMAGNVSEWVADLYRPTTSLTLRDSENHDLNPFRGNTFKAREKDENDALVQKDSLGRIKYRYVEDEEVQDRENYKTGEARNYFDGDDPEYVQYAYGLSTLISDKSRVYKGGSWADRAYWMAPGTRRFMEEDKSSRSVGFRCAMTRTGGPTGNDDTAGNKFQTKRKKVKRKYK